MYKRADTSWMKGSFGLSFHWTTQTMCQNGEHMPYQEAVERFDVTKLADALSSVDARHCIFTLTHAKQYLAFPNKALEGILPGRTTKRDLIGEIIEELSARDMRFIAYYNHSCNGGGDAEWEKVSGYSGGKDGGLDRFARNILDIVSFTAERYGKGISAWWFDSGYSVDPKGPRQTINCDMGDWQFPWEELNVAAKRGHSDCAVTFSAGVGRSHLYSTWQDYYAGETVELDQAFAPKTLEMQDHRWITVDNRMWVYNEQSVPPEFTTLRFPAEDFIKFKHLHQAEGRMVTFNVNIDQLTNVNPRIIELKG